MAGDVHGFISQAWRSALDRIFNADGVKHARRVLRKNLDVGSGCAARGIPWHDRGHGYQATLDDNPEFRNPGVITRADGTVVVTVVGQLFSFNPNPIEIPAGKPVTFRLTSADVVHGFEVVGTNANAMAIPGYVSQFTVTFKPGEYIIGCNEYCGVAHHTMVGKLIAQEESR